jgi:CheY-like chemotaxis protein
LSTVYGFIRQCGGYIFVASAQGLGTSIELLLPRAPDIPAGAPPPEPTSTPVGAVADGTMETILVAEDQDEVRRLVVQTLRRAGYTVIDAGSGDEALRAAERFDGAIHLLLSDVVMPGMKGPELAARMRAVRPLIHVVLMSGYAADVVTKDDLDEATLLSKPFPPSLLAQTVRQVLDQPLSRRPRPKG